MVVGLVAELEAAARRIHVVKVKQALFPFSVVIDKIDA